jgi:hypothetical protein
MDDGSIGKEKRSCHFPKGRKANSWQGIQFSDRTRTEMYSVAACHG